MAPLEYDEDDGTLMPFGRHAGKPLRLVPTGYLRMLVRGEIWSRRLRRAIEVELEARGIEPPDRW